MIFDQSDRQICTFLEGACVKNLQLHNQRREVVAEHPCSPLDVIMVRDTSLLPQLPLINTTQINHNTIDLSFKQKYLDEIFNET